MAKDPRRRTRSEEAHRGAERLGGISFQRLFRHRADGPLPLFLAVLTVVSGLMDAVTFLLLGHVFVANMTGNVVVLGFGLSGYGGGYGAGTSAISVGGFLCGALVGGRASRRLPEHRGWVLCVSAVCVAALVATALTVLWLPAERSLSEERRITAIVILACGMGLQSALVRHVAVADMKTTAVTSTTTALAADSRLAGGTGRHGLHQAVSVLTMMTGGLTGALLLRSAGVRAPLGLAVGLLLITAAGLAMVSRYDAPWQRTRPG